MPGDQLAALVQAALVVPFQVEEAAWRLVAAANSAAAILKIEFLMAVDGGVWVFTKS
jgi:hypothetical protein